MGASGGRPGAQGNPSEGSEQGRKAGPGTLGPWGWSRGSGSGMNGSRTQGNVERKGDHADRNRVVQAWRPRGFGLERAWGRVGVDGAGADGQGRNEPFCPAGESVATSDQRLIGGWRSAHGQGVVEPRRTATWAQIPSGVEDGVPDAPGGIRWPRGTAAGAGPSPGAALRSEATSQAATLHPPDRHSRQAAVPDRPRRHRSGPRE